MDPSAPKEAASRTPAEDEHEPQVHNHDPFTQRATPGSGGLSGVQMVPVSLLLPSDSPRSGEGNVEYLQLLTAADVALPPIIVHRPTMRVIDGMYRLKRALARGEQQIAARFFDGDEQEAFVLAVRSNVTHGLPLTTRDRAAAALRIIASYPDWSNKAIAAVAGLSDKTVADMRTAVAGSQVVARIGRDGRRRPIDGALGRLAARELIEQRPHASNREIARLAGIAPATARDVRHRLSRGEDPLPPSQHARRPQAKNSNGDDAPVPLRKRHRVVALDSSPAEAFAKLDSLMRDPSLRLTETGRALLRSLSLHRPLHEHQTEMVSAIPPHWAGPVSEMARACAMLWLQVAQEAEDRAQTIPRPLRRTS